MHSNIDRWQLFIDQGKSYTDRIKKMATYINHGSSVLDIGAGLMELRNYLPEGCTYYPCDLIKTSDDTIVLDLNKDFELSGQWDIGFCSGVLEYVDDPLSVLRKLKNHFEYMLISYCFVDDVPEWAFKYEFHNHINYNEFRVILRSLHMHIIKEDQWTSRHKIFYLKVNK